MISSHSQRREGLYAVGCQSGSLTFHGMAWQTRGEELPGLVWLNWPFVGFPFRRFRCIGKRFVRSFVRRSVPYCPVPLDQLKEASSHIPNIRAVHSCPLAVAVDRRDPTRDPLAIDSLEGSLAGPPRDAPIAAQQDLLPAPESQGPGRQDPLSSRCDTNFPFSFPVVAIER